MFTVYLFCSTILLMLFTFLGLFVSLLLVLVSSFLNYSKFNILKKIDGELSSFKFYGQFGLLLVTLLSFAYRAER